MRDLLILGNTNPQNRQISQKEYDRLYHPLFQAMKATKESAQDISRIISLHEEGISSGNLVDINNNSFSIRESIDDELNQELGMLLDNGVISAKNLLQNFLKKIYGINIGFLYQEHNGFRKGKDALRVQGEYEFAKYLEQVRSSWLEEFIFLRGLKHHEGWTLDPVDYSFVTPKTVSVTFPKVNDVQVDEYAIRSANRIILFIETSIAYGFQTSKRVPIYLIEIPMEKRANSGEIAQ